MSEKIDTKEDLKSKFAIEYNELCRKYNMMINVQPVFVARDDGTFSIKLIPNIVFMKTKG